MQFTKQDIKKISQQLAKTAVKDSQFKEIGSAALHEDSTVVFVQDNENIRIKLKDLMSAIDAKIVPGTTKPLSQLLKDLILAIGTGSGNTFIVGADDVSYDMSQYINDAFNVKIALDTLLKFAYGKAVFPCAASESDIEEIFSLSE